MRCPPATEPMKNNTANPTEVPIFFILGRGRSGSTLLRTMLDAHPEIAIPQESRFVQYLSYKYEKRKLWPSGVLESFYQELLQCYESQEVDCELLHHRIFSLKAPITFAMLCKQVYLSIKSPFAKDNIRLIGDKNPRYAFMIPALHRIFPEARFVHLVRDYRDSTLSFFQVKGMDFEKKNAAFLALKWRVYNNQVLKYQRKHPDVFYTLNYEDLVKDPEPTLRGLCTFLGLSFDPLMLAYDATVRKQFGETGHAYQNIHQGLTRPVNTEKSGRWRTEMQTADVKVSDMIAGKVAADCGYERRYKGRYPMLFMRHLPYIVYAWLVVWSKIIFYRVPFLMRLFYALKK